MSEYKFGFRISSGGGQLDVNAKDRILLNVLIEIAQEANRLGLKGQKIIWSGITKQPDILTLENEYELTFRTEAIDNGPFLSPEAFLEFLKDET